MFEGYCHGNRAGLWRRSLEGGDWGHEAAIQSSLLQPGPGEVISHPVWLYHVFSLSLLDVELLLDERGVTVSYETVWQRCQKFGGSFAHAMRRRRPRPGDKWHMDKVFILRTRSSTATSIRGVTS